MDVTELNQHYKNREEKEKKPFKGAVIPRKET